jgi:class 3 adenylate cyclase
VTQPTWTPTQCTVLFADLRGSTALYQQLGNAAAAAVVTAAVLGLSNSARSQAGRVVKTLGDGLIVLFDGTPAGVQAGLVMQEALAKAVEALSVIRTSTLAEAIRLHKAGTIAIYRKGKPVGNPDEFKGVYRLGLPPG